MKNLEQYVCKNCGFNIIGYHPDNCPFCGAPKENFITAEDCSEQYKIIRKKVTEKVYLLKSDPPLGLEHNAYKIKTLGHVLWIDCPSTFDKSVEKMDINLFTHHHFIAAANLYKKNFDSRIWIPIRDSNNYIANKYEFDREFDSNFTLYDLNSYHINGHTNGFTSYIFHNCLFICDYVFIGKNSSKFNPYGPYQPTLKGAKELLNLLSSKEIEFVCGYNYTLNFKDWIKKLKILIKKRN
ncbi:MAG: MBL fold metallo-hydrolase [Promethearchaeota archaeon]|nr:MAG: MBL fold metallo-hydrolase [Candidatus Lokiarchaeota archaeon]